MNGQSAVIKAVCISEKKGQQKHPIESVHLRPEHGIDGDAHAGNWHRQVSLLGQESVDRLQEKISIPLIGKECHADCAIRQQAGDCVMPREGIFVIVLEEGDAKAGDLVTLEA